MTFKIYFLKNHAQYVVEKLLPDPFLKCQNWAYLWINNLNFYTAYLYCMPKLRAIEIYWNQAAHHWFLPHLKLLKKTKKVLQLVSLHHFLHDFWRKIFLLINSINIPNFNILLFLLREILANMCIVILY